MPGVRAIENREILRKIKVEESIGRKCPEAVEESIHECGEPKYKGPGVVS